MRITAMLFVLIAWPCALVLMPDGYWDEKGLWLIATPFVSGGAYWLAGLFR